MAKQKTKSKYGPRYNPDYHPELARCCALGGHIDEEIARLMGLNRTTIHNWKKRHPEFAEALKGGKKVTDDKVVKSLLERALGEEWTEVKTRRDAKGNILEITTTKKKLAGSTTAQIFWLKNRDPKDWRDVQAREHSGEINVAGSWAELVKGAAERRKEKDGSE